MDTDCTTHITHDSYDAQHDGADRIRMPIVKRARGGRREVMCLVDLINTALNRHIKSPATSCPVGAAMQLSSSGPVGDEHAEATRHAGENLLMALEGEGT